MNPVPDDELVTDNASEVIEDVEALALEEEAEAERYNEEEGEVTIDENEATDADFIDIDYSEAGVEVVAVADEEEVTATDPESAEPEPTVTAEEEEPAEPEPEPESEPTPTPTPPETALQQSVRSIATLHHSTSLGSNSGDENGNDSSSSAPQSKLPPTLPKTLDIASAEAALAASGSSAERQSPKLVTRRLSNKYLENINATNSASASPTNGSLTGTGTGTIGTGKSPTFANRTVAIKCLKCTKSIYPNDPQLNLDSKMFHKSCAKCADCNCQITLSNFTKNGDSLLCKTHYFERFAKDNNYVGSEQFVGKNSTDVKNM